MEQISVFDIFKIGVGPSSSHTMGPWVAAQLFLEKVDVSKIFSLKVKLYGSLSKTGKGHGTDVAVQLGLAGFDAKTIDVNRIDEYIEDINREKEININKEQLIDFNPLEDIEFHNEKLPFHPNGMTIIAGYEDGSLIEETYYSIGGGFVVQEGEESVHHEEVKFPFPIASEKDLLAHIAKEGLSIYEIVWRNEFALRPTDEIDFQVNELWKAMKSSIYNGCHKNGTLPGGLNVIRRAFNINVDLIG
ncbi:MAG: serine dehydratase beta chain, partial [Vicingaceae bacterium]